MTQVTFYDKIFSDILVIDKTQTIEIQAHFVPKNSLNPDSSFDWLFVAKTRPCRHTHNYLTPSSSSLDLLACDIRASFLCWALST
jgi:hypothetical protein